MPMFIATVWIDGLKPARYIIRRPADNPITFRQRLEADYGWPEVDVTIGVISLSKDQRGSEAEPQP